MKIKLILSLCTAVLITEPLSAAAPQGNWLTQAAHDDNLAEVQHLLDESADPDSTNNSGDTPLCQAIINKNIKMVQALLDAGADPNKADTYGNTPLHLAILCNCNNVEIAQALLDKGADLTIHNDAGKTPAQLTINTSMATFLKKTAKNPMLKSAHKV